MKRNKFNLSHYKLGTCDMNRLVPVSCFEVLPGDTIQMHTSLFLRMAPMLAPVMHPVRVGIYSFYVPLRLLWKDFENFITGGPDGLDTSVPPTITYNQGVGVGTLINCLGVPPGYTGPFSALPLRAYLKIFNEYFRDQDLVSEATVGNNVNGGPNVITSGNGVKPYLISWEKDYFTTARPWPQKGAQVTVPVDAPSSQDQTINVSISGAPSFTGLDSADSRESGVVSGNGTLYYQTGTNDDPVINQIGLAAGSLAGSFVQPGSGSGNGQIGSVNLDQLREAFALQRFEEHRAMYGSRYTEYLRYLGVRSSDARLQRPEYLGGGKSTIQFSEVLQTGEDGTNPVGTLRGHGIGVNRSRTFRRFIEEHGLILTLAVIRPISIYMQGLHKMWSRQVKEDYWQKELEHIGQQEILEKEIYATGDTTSAINDNSVFGYNNRYDEYRHVPSNVCGDMYNTLDFWHMARSFANAPVLNSSFLNGEPTKRIFAEQTKDPIYFMAQNSVVARRILSKNGNPIM